MLPSPGPRRDGTRVVRAGLPAPEQGEPFLPGPSFSAPVHLSGDPASSPYVYGRYGNPTWTAYERALAELEGGEAVLFASGMAAVSAILLPLRAGDVLVLPADCYMGVRTLAEGELRGRGVELRPAPTAGEGLRKALPGATMLWLETPSNPGLDVCEIESLAAAAHEEGALVAVDNTLATPLGQRPLDRGADLSVASGSKYLTGHADLILGYVAVRDSELAADLRGRRTATGAVAGPFEAWLAHRSLATLDVRLERQCAGALALAEALAARPDVADVRFPGLPGDPAHELASRQMTRFGSVVGFTLESLGHAERFLAEAELVIEATSFGGVYTTAERRGRWSGDDVPDGFIRMNVGCESIEDLLADVARALDAVAGG